MSLALGNYYTLVLDCVKENITYYLILGGFSSSLSVTNSDCKCIYVKYAGIEISIRVPLILSVLTGLMILSDPL